MRQGGVEVPEFLGEGGAECWCWELEKERDFYFSKLREVEIMCQENEANGGDVIRKVLDILYQTEDGFAVPEEEEGVPPPPEGDEEY